MALLIPGLAIGSASAQQCYTPITSWNTEFKLSGSASGVACNNGATCDISESASASDLSIVPGFVSCNPAAVGWGGSAPSPAGSDTWSVNDTANFAPCEGGGVNCKNFSGPTSSGGPNVASSGLIVNVANGTYTYAGISGALERGISLSAELTRLQRPGPSWLIPVLTGLSRLRSQAVRPKL